MNLADVIGQTLDYKYKIENEIGRGGMGSVYLATHVGTERPVAVKIINPQYMKRAEFVERFRREARAAGRLRHPNVVDVTEHYEGWMQSIMCHESQFGKPELNAQMRHFFESNASRWARWGGGKYAQAFYSPWPLNCSDPLTAANIAL